MGETDAIKKPGGDMKDETKTYPYPIPDVSDLKPRPADKLYPHRMDRMQKSICVICNNPVNGFRDEISQKEYLISGLCQTCQDSFFKKNGKRRYDPKLIAYMEACRATEKLFYVDERGEISSPDDVNETAGKLQGIKLGLGKRIFDFISAEIPEARGMCLFTVESLDDRGEGFCHMRFTPYGNLSPQSCLRMIHAIMDFMRKCWPDYVAELDARSRKRRLKRV